MGVYTCALIIAVWHLHCKLYFCPLNLVYPTAENHLRLNTLPLNQSLLFASERKLKVGCWLLKIHTTLSMSSIIFSNSRLCKINMYCMDWNHINYKTNSLFIQVEFFYLFPLNKKWKKSVYFFQVYYSLYSSNQVTHI